MGEIFSDRYINTESKTNVSQISSAFIISQYDDHMLLIYAVCSKSIEPMKGGRLPSVEMWRGH
jgi:hypothetical protein